MGPRRVVRRRGVRPGSQHGQQTGLQSAARRTRGRVQPRHRLALPSPHLPYGAQRRGDGVPAGRPPGTRRQARTRRTGSARRPAGRARWARTVSPPPCAVPATHRAGAPDPSETTSTRGKGELPLSRKGFPLLGQRVRCPGRSIQPDPHRGSRSVGQERGSPSPMRVSSSSTGPSPIRSRTASATACRNTAGGTGQSAHRHTRVQVRDAQPRQQDLTFVQPHRNRRRTLTRWSSASTCTAAAVFGVCRRRTSAASRPGRRGRTPGPSRWRSPSPRSAAGPAWSPPSAPRRPRSARRRSPGRATDAG